jgi:hypothetical protein
VDPDVGFTVNISKELGAGVGSGGIKVGGGVTREETGGGGLQESS